MKRESPQSVAYELLHTRYQGAELLFVAGSVGRGQGTPTSDLDLVVIYPQVDRSYREAFVFRGWPVEAFVHDPETLNYFFSEVDARDGIPSLPWMVVEGRPLPEHHAWVSSLKSLASKLLVKGPETLSQVRRDEIRYYLTDLHSDLQSAQDSFEVQVIASEMHSPLADFWFRSQQKWSASGKQIRSRMEKLDPEFARHWREVFESAFRGEKEKLLSLTEKILGMEEGFLVDGFKRFSNPNNRKPLPQKSVNEIPWHLQTGDQLLEQSEKQIQHPKLGLVTVRAVRDQDIGALRELLNSAYQELARKGLNYNASFQDEELTAEGLMDGQTLIMENNGQMIATMKMSFQTLASGAKCLYLGRFAVRPDLQGEGLGSRLLCLSEAIAKRNQCHCLRLDTAQNAERLVQFYLKSGFAILDRIYHEGKTYVSWILEKKCDCHFSQ